MPNEVNRPPLHLPFVDNRGYLMRPWQRFFEDFFRRVGGEQALTNTELEEEIFEVAVLESFEPLRRPTEAPDPLTLFEPSVPTSPALDVGALFQAVSPCCDAPSDLLSLFPQMPPRPPAPDILSLFPQMPPRPPAPDILSLFTAIAAPATAAALDVESSTYTPTLTNVANLTGSTAQVCAYIRVGTNVIVGGAFDADATLAVGTQLGISLPIASNFASSTECGGVHAIVASPSECGMIYGDITNNRAEAGWIAGALANQRHCFVFMYQII